jgi:hypothetical protein
MHGKDRIRGPAAEQPFDRLRLALYSVDGLGLLAVFIDREHQQRFSISSSRSMAVVVRKIITGPSTRY